VTGQYSIRNGLSLIAIEGNPYTLPANAFTMGELFKSVGYATAIFGKRHLGSASQSLPTAHGFDEFYGIPPDISWDAATYPATIALTHSSDEPYEALLRTGPQIVEAKAGGQLRTVKPFTEDVRANIDNDLVDRSIGFMRRQKAAGRPVLAVLDGALPEPAFATVQGQVADRQLRRQDNGRGLPRRPDPRHAEGTWR
jgi:Sulfatase